MLGATSDPRNDQHSIQTKGRKSGLVDVALRSLTVPVNREGCRETATIVLELGGPDCILKAVSGKAGRNCSQSSSLWLCFLGNNGEEGS